MSDQRIVACARRLVKKLESRRFHTINGEFSSSVKQEIKRMKHLCRPEGSE